jgi:hypothetical protein
VWRLTGLVASEVQLATVDFRSTIDFNQPEAAVICGFNINQICRILTDLCAEYVDVESWI